MKKLSKKDIDFLIDLSIRAGRKLKKYHEKVRQLKILSKDCEGVVTEADIETEKFIKKELLKKFPETNFLGEESFFDEHGLKSEKNLNKYQKLPNCWILDPLDGTSNFVKGSDYFCISLALVHKGKTNFGLIYAPMKKHLFYAKKDFGTFFKDLNQKNSKFKKIFEKRTQTLEASLVSTGYGGTKGFEQGLLKDLIENSLGIRKQGSAALDLCYVTLGHTDAFVASNLAPWDQAAGSLILSEANFLLSDFKGRAFNPFKSEIVACKKGLKAQVLSMTKPYSRY